MSAGVRHLTLIDDVCFAGCDRIGVPLHGVDSELNPLDAALREFAHIECMQCRGSGASIDLCLDRGYLEFREAYPLPPSECDAFI